MDKLYITNCAAQQGAVDDKLFVAAPQAAPGSTE